MTLSGPPRQQASRNEPLTPLYKPRHARTQSHNPTHSNTTRHMATQPETQQHITAARENPKFINKHETIWQKYSSWCKLRLVPRTLPSSHQLLSTCLVPRTLLLIKLLSSFYQPVWSDSGTTKQTLISRVIHMYVCITRSSIINVYSLCMAGCCQLSKLVGEKVTMCQY